MDAIFAYLSVRGRNAAQGTGTLGIPALAKAHPLLARAFEPGANEEAILSVSLGVAEPISAERAQLYADAINLRGLDPPFRL